MSIKNAIAEATANKVDWIAVRNHCVEVGKHKHRVCLGMFRSKISYNDVKDIDAFIPRGLNAHDANDPLSVAIDRMIMFPLPGRTKTYHWYGLIGEVDLRTAKYARIKYALTTGTLSFQPKEYSAHPKDFRHIGALEMSTHLTPTDDPMSNLHQEIMAYYESLRLDHGFVLFNWGSFATKTIPEVCQPQPW